MSAPAQTQPVSDAVTKPVEDSVPKVDGEIAVGENLEFQRKWWKFERAIWILFLILLVCDVLGLFGRGWLSKATQTSPDSAIKVDYERIERASTPSIVTIKVGDAGIQGGEVHLFISDSLVKQLGAQRISPQPAVSAVGDNGISYTFPATHSPAFIQIALEPSFPGLHRFRIQSRESAPIDATVFVVP